MEFKRSDLTLTYSWSRTPGDSPATQLDRLYLNKREGYEVLYFINHNLNNYVTYFNLASVEKLIRDCTYHIRTEVKEYVIRNL